MRARCGCGQAIVTISGDPRFVIACHCRECQRRTGAPFGVGVYFDRRAVKLEGDMTEYARATDSGGTLRTCFCPVCATSLCWTIDAHPDLLAVAIGAIEDPPAASVHSLWERSRLEGFAIECATLRYERGYPTG